MTRFPGVRAVTFDCWGTLIYEPDIAPSLTVRISAVAEATGLNDDDAGTLLGEAWAWHVAAWQRHEQVGSPGIVRYIHERHPLGDDAQTVLLDRLEIGAGTDGIAPVPGARETLERIKNFGLSTALVCDTGMRPGKLVRELLMQHELAPLLDVLIFSDEIGVPKPERRMFDAALSAIGGGPAVHIGDLRRTDIAGARGAGLGAVRFRGVYDDASDHPDGDEIIDDLLDLTRLLGIPA